MIDYLTGDEIKRYEHELEKIEFALKNIKNSPYSTERSMDIKPMLQQKQKIEKLLNKKRPPELNTEKKNKLWRRAKELENMIKRDMPKKSQMSGKYVVHGTGHTVETDEFDVRQQVEWTKRTRKWIDEYRNICRILDPYNRKLISIERMRSNL
jgi:hypothetical protein